MFYKIDGGEHIVSANGVSAPAFSLTEETHTEHTYPVDGWYWYATAAEALEGLSVMAGSVTALQGMQALRVAGKAEAFVTWRNTLDPVDDFEIIAFLDKARRWERNNPILQAAATALGFTDAQVDNLFVLAATL
jgi:hypothetical protein